jgi:peptidase E
MPRSILAVGGRGFSVLEPTPSLDSFFVDLAGARHPVVGLIPTASGDPDVKAEAFRHLCARRGWTPQVISLFWRGEAPLEEEVGACDVIWVGGGNTWNMLQLWRLWGLDKLLREAYEKCVPLGGVSAGANCWFEQCSTDSFRPRLDVMEGLGWLEGSYCPHYDSEGERRPTLERFMKGGLLGPGYACEEGVGLLFEDEALQGVVADGAGQAYRVGLSDGVFSEEALPCQRLGTPS